MGCDIHLYAEKKVDGRWVAADHWEGGSVNYDDLFYSTRSYDTFAILADVRNGTGFAGIKTGQGFNVIAAPRGLPEDCSPEVKANAAGWGRDGHSHSWLTVQEIMEFDWTQVSTKQGWVDLGEWAEFKVRGKPSSWCGDVGGGGVKHLTEEEFQKAWTEVATARKLPTDKYSARRELTHDTATRAQVVYKLGGSPYCLVSWDVKYYETCSEFVGKTLPRLWRLGRPEDVRIVFWFDN